MISQGNNPRTTNTAKIIPQTRNHLRPFGDMVSKTSALTIALSALEIISNNASPRIVMIEVVNMRDIIPSIDKFQKIAIIMKLGG